MNNLWGRYYFRYNLRCFLIHFFFNNFWDWNLNFRFFGTSNSLNCIYNSFKTFFNMLSNTLFFSFIYNFFKFISNWFWSSNFNLWWFFYFFSSDWMCWRRWYNLNNLYWFWFWRSNWDWWNNFHYLWLLNKFDNLWWHWHWVNMWFLYMCWKHCYWFLYLFWKLVNNFMCNLNSVSINFLFVFKNIIINWLEIILSLLCVLTDFSTGSD